MKKRNNPKFEEYLAKTQGNQMDVLSSEKCGCVFCRAVYDAREVADWTNNLEGLTALCPRCGMATVLPDVLGIPLDYDSLKAMNLYAFGEDYMVEHPEALRLYCSRYIDGEITHKKANESLFVKYLTTLYQRKEAPAAALLGYFYMTGGEFHEPNLRKAVSIFSSPLLAEDEVTLCRLGSIYIDGYGGEEGAKKGFEILTKALALGSEEAIFYVAKCYFEGIAVEEDPIFAFTVLYREFDVLFHRFRRSTEDIHLFVEFAYQIGYCCDKGIGTREDKVRALRYYLLADLGLRSYKTVPETEPFEDELASRISEIATLLGFKEGPATFDQDSFFDSFAEQQENLSNKELINPFYNEEDKTLSFGVNFEERQILVDLGNLYCEFIDGNVSWEFRDIAGIKQGVDPLRYHFVNFASEEGWYFVDDEQHALSIRFLNPADLEDEKAIKNP